MRKLSLLCLLLIFSSWKAGAQGYFQRMETKERKYFADFGYGFGTARWYSKIEQSALFQPSGNILRAGNIRFKAKNNCAALHFAIMAPVRKIRAGLGIAFESFYLDNLEVQTDNHLVKDNRNLLLFDESFQFQKMFVQVEVPFKYESKSNGSLNFKSHFGYYSYSGIRRMNFFGQNIGAQTFFGTLGLTADYKFYPHTYVFLFPNVELKYFNNSRLELPSNIIHRILTASVIAGIRIDMSKE